jgi:hypothetical protein
LCKDETLVLSEQEGQTQKEKKYMEQNIKALKQKSKKAAHTLQEQDWVLPLVRELENAELDFVAGGRGDTIVSSALPPYASQAQQHSRK